MTQISLHHTHPISTYAELYKYDPWRTIMLRCWNVIFWRLEIRLTRVLIRQRPMRYNLGGVVKLGVVNMLGEVYMVGIPS